MGLKLKSAIEIHGLTDSQLIRYKRFLHQTRNTREGESLLGNPRKARWCFYEVKRELHRRGLAPRPSDSTRSLHV